MRFLLVIAALAGCIGPELHIAVTGQGEGAVSSMPDAIHCGEDCATILEGTMVLMASARPGSTFGGWSGGGCSGTEPCTLVPGQDVMVTARFDITLFELAVALDGTGDGSVTSDQAGIACGTDCTEVYPEGTPVTLVAAPAADSKFMRWSGGCSGTSTTCEITLAQAQQVTASFSARNPQLLTVTRSGVGTGSVTSSPTGIICGADCTESYDMGTVVTLTAMPGASSMFAGWTGGGCSGTGTCTTTVAAASTIDAAFAHVPYALSVMPAGTGTGTVTSTPLGISCGSDCSEAYPYNTVVSLVATPAAGSAFVSWSGGGCTGTGVCTVTVDQAFAVGALFNRLHALTVVRNGGGKVTSNVTGIDCGSDCSENYQSAATVTLTATPASGATFLGWTGACTNTSGTCTVSMSADATATATFSVPPCVSFSALARPQVGTYPDGMATGDFNGDGKVDLAVGNHDSSSVSVLLGKGDGTFQTAHNFNAGSFPFGVAVGDFNGDGKLDVAVANLYTVALLLGNGDGTLQTAVDYNTGGNPQEITVGDVNADGKLDLAVSNANNGPLSILLGNGNGTFQTAVNYTVGPYPSGTAIGDYNGDGNVDLAVAIANAQRIDVLLGNGNGTFQTAVPVSISTQGGPYDIATKDLNGDGKLDLVAAGTDSGVTVLRGNGNGTFQPSVNYAVGLGSFSVSLADMTGDGRLDIVATSPGSQIVAVLRGNGDATFQTPVTFATGSDPEVVVTADFDGDGKLDIATADRWEGTTLTVLRNASTCTP
jgi:hypothetical protein